MNSEKQSTNLQMTLREVNRVGERQKNVPKIRFKGYEDAWEQRKLGSAIIVRSGKDYKHLDEGDVPVYGTGGYMLSVSEALENTQDAIGIGRKGTIDKPFVLKAPFWTVDTLFYCIPKGNNSLGFLYPLFQSINWKLYDESTGVPSLSKTAIEGVTINLTSKVEQYSIGEYFESVDNLITLHQRKYDALKTMKKTLLSKMFPKDGEDVPEIRFKGFTDAWEQRRLEEIFLKIRNAFVGTSTPYYVEKNQGGHFYIESNNVKHGQINHDTEVFINEEFYQNQKDKWLKTGDIVMVQSGHVGHSAVIPEYLNNSAAHALIMFQEYLIETNPNFINFQFQTESVRNKIDSITTGNTIKHILASDMKLFSISNTQKKEADKLGDFFISLDNLITLHQRKLDELKNMKKTLLQQMFV